MWIVDIVILALFLLGVFIYEIAEYKVFGLLYVGILAVAAWFFFGPFKDFVIATGWKVLLLKWFPIYLGVGVGVALLKWIQLNLKVASHIKETKEGLAKFDAAASVSIKNTEISARRNGTSAPVLPPTQAEIDAERRIKFIELWNSSEREDDLPSVKTDSRTNWNDPDIITELLTPRAKKSISTISFWILEWPFVIVSTVIGDLLLKFGKHVAKLFDKLFTNLGKALVRHASKGI